MSRNRTRKRKNNFIKDTFLKLTSKTVPHRMETEFVNEMIGCGLFPRDIQKDPIGNYYYKIGESRTVFTSHLDTVSGKTSPVTHVIEGNLIKTNGSTILGADDKAGVTILLFMIKNQIPGLYYFFVGEEVGCVGSSAASRRPEFKNYDRMISFDRRDVWSVITYQSFSRCCSNEFANQLADELNKSGLKYKIDTGGIYTDSAEFTNIIPECTNLSVGYYNEHSTRETQDIAHLRKLAEACLLVDWENLVTRRDPSKTEYKSYGGRYGGYDDWYNDEFYSALYLPPKKDTIEPSKFFDNGDGILVPYKEPEKKIIVGDYYDCLIGKIVENKITREELDIVKEQYFDMTNDNDKMFYNYLLINING